MKQIRSLLTAALLLAGLVACQSGDYMLSDDFHPFHDGKISQMPGSHFAITDDNPLNFSTRRNVRVGDNAKAIAAEYGDIVCDISYEQESGGFTTLDKATMRDFITEAQPRYYIVTYMLLIADGELYRQNEIDDAPQHDDYTLYYLEFEVTDDVITTITYNHIEIVGGEELENEADEMADAAEG